MPQVFRRLTAPLGGVAVDELSRARVALASPSQHSGPTMSLGGIMHNDEHGLHASAYLQALLETHEVEAGHVGVGSRRFQEDEFHVRRSPRVPEEKAKEIFDRLYKSGEEHRVRRRVYHELGVLVEQAKEAQSCTFEPRCPTAGYPSTVPRDVKVTDRLYQEGIDRRRRREERQRDAPLPSFRPQTLSSTCLGPVRRNLAVSPRETLASGDAGVLGEDEVDADVSRESPHLFETTHVRLFREHQERKARQTRRQKREAEWTKHTFRPDISTSQASGPQISRGNSQYLSAESNDVQPTDESQVADYHAGLKAMDDQLDYMHRIPTPLDFSPAFESTLADANMAAA